MASHCHTITVWLLATLRRVVMKSVSLPIPLCFGTHYLLLSFLTVKPYHFLKGRFSTISKTLGLLILFSLYLPIFLGLSIFHLRPQGGLFPKLKPTTQKKKLWCKILPYILPTMLPRHSCIILTFTFTPFSPQLNHVCLIL